MVIIGTFKIISNVFQLKNDDYWDNDWVFKIKSIKLSKEPFLPLKTILTEEKRLKLFPEGKIKGINLKGRTAISIPKNDFKIIEDYIKKFSPSKNLFKGLSNDAGLGEPIDIGIMGFTPTNEMGVVALFVRYMGDLGFDKFEFIRRGFPDACVYEKTDVGRERKYVEF